MQRGLRSLAHRDREAQERVALHHLLLRLLGLLGDVLNPEQVNAFGDAAPNIESPTVISLPGRRK